MNTLPIQTGAREEILDITHQIQKAVSASGVERGICQISVQHTTAGLTVNENADPAVKRDILMALDRLVPQDWPYTHAEGNSPAHVKSSLMGSSLTLIIEGGRLALGTWQGVCLCEFDGPRRRRIAIEILPSP
jgi:secondary thiamine-phosphate synthase enzyme